ncbi:MAG: hypothetical protein JNL81_11030 [Hyphomonadaceae bacterium]|nr:hypothetical protein [Hyphomonadaceae bacterium]
MRRDREAANRRYAGFTAGVLFSVLALSVSVWLLRPAELDAATLCPKDRQLAGHTVVIVDRTDRWTQAMGSALTQLVENAQRDTDRYEKFSIVALDSENSVHPLFSICNPGEPTFWSDLYRGRRYTTRDFEQRFVGAAERVIEDVREPAEANTSPIVEYVHRWLGSDDFSPEVRQRRLILVSDMRQNSALFSIYTGAEDQLSDVVERQFGPSAQGVAFDVYFVAHGRDHNVSEDEVRTAWDHAFGRIGADYSWRQIS